jgi:hypothetical protein
MCTFRPISITVIWLVIVSQCYGQANANAVLNENAAYAKAKANPNLLGKIDALETFLRQYPKSPLRKAALKELFQDYRQPGAGSIIILMGKISWVARQIVELDPQNVTALAIVTLDCRSAAENGVMVQQNLEDGARYGRLGLKALDRTTHEQIQGNKNGLDLVDKEALFAGAIGINAFDKKHYEDAEKYLWRAVQLLRQKFDDLYLLRNIYQLALVYLDQSPPLRDKGVFFLALATHLARESHPDIASAISEYGQSEYARLYRDEKGWEAFVLSTQDAPLPPFASPKASR